MAVGVAASNGTRLLKPCGLMRRGSTFSPCGLLFARRSTTPTNTKRYPSRCALRSSSARPDASETNLPR